MVALLSQFLDKHSYKLFSSLLLGAVLALFAPGHAVSSLTIMALLAFAFYNIFVHRTIYWNQLSVLVILLYIWMMVSGLWSDEISYFGERIRIKSSLIAIAFCFLFFKNIKGESLNKGLLFFVYAMIFSSIFIWFHYVFHHVEVLSGLYYGSSMPVPFRSHIRYGLLLDLAFLISLHYTIETYGSKRFFWHLAITLYFVLLIHFVSVRMAILGLYISILCYALYYYRMLWKYKQITISMLLLMIVFVLLLIQIPTFKTKVGYMLYDWEQMKAQNISNYSDGERIQSIYHGISLIEKNPWLGVGEGDLKKEMMALGNTLSGDVKMPHNQFVWTWSACGIVGFLLWVAIFVVLYGKSVRSKSALLCSYTTIILSSMMIESTIETQIGALIFVLPLCFFYNNASLFRTRI